MPTGKISLTGGHLATKSQTDRFRREVNAFFATHPKMTAAIFDAGIGAKCYIKHIRQRDCRRTRKSFMDASREFMQYYDPNNSPSITKCCAPSLAERDLTQSHDVDVPDDGRPGMAWLSTQEVVSLCGGTMAQLHGWMNNHLTAAWHERMTVGAKDHPGKRRWLHQDELDRYDAYCKSHRAARKRRSDEEMDEFVALLKLQKKTEQRRESSFWGKVRRSLQALRLIWRGK